MVRVELKVKLEELRIGKKFDLDELIIDRFESEMITIRREPESNEIRRFFYDIAVTGNNLIINNNGYGEFDNNDDYYYKYKKMLREAGLW